MCNYLAILFVVFGAIAVVLLFFLFLMLGPATTVVFCCCCIIPSVVVRSTAFAFRLPPPATKYDVGSQLVTLFLSPPTPPTEFLCCCCFFFFCFYNWSGVINGYYFVKVIRLLLLPMPTLIHCLRWRRCWRCQREESYYRMGKTHLHTTLGLCYWHWCCYCCCSCCYDDCTATAESTEPKGKMYVMLCIQRHFNGRRMCVWKNQYNLAQRKKRKYQKLYKFSPHNFIFFFLKHNE